MNFRKEYNANVMAIRRGKNLNLAPGGQDKILEGDTLIIMGRNDQLEDLKEE
ncbi:MAG: cation:proton antiporter regulatory subunit [Halanaerobium sp.]